MKFILLVILPLLLMCSCVTTPKTPEERVHDGAKVAACLTAALDLKSNPSRLEAYREARRGLAQLTLNEVIDPLQVAVYLQSTLPIKELKGETSIVTITAVALLFADQVGAMEIKNPDMVKALTSGLKDGLDQALKPYESEG